MTMRGTPYNFNGDEIGMVNIRFDNIEDYNDVDTRNKYEQLKNSGGDLKAFLENKKQTSRENGRTPFQWDASVNGGFTTGKPWLKVNPNYAEINAAAQEKDPNSVLNYYRKLVKIRKASPVLQYGKYTLLDHDNPNVFAYTRELDGKKVVVLLNFTEKEAAFNLGFSTKNTTLILGNYPTTRSSKSNTLRPYESLILEIK
jgi:oligo-1,6-glucosidase